MPAKGSVCTSGREIFNEGNSRTIGVGRESARRAALSRTAGGRNYFFRARVRAAFLAAATRPARPFVRTALRAAAFRDPAPRLRAAVRACLDKARRDAA